MARRPTPQPPVRPKLNENELHNGIARLQKRIAEVEALNPQELEKWSPKVTALQAAIDGTLAHVFGQGTVEYSRYRQTVNWGEDIPSFGNSTSLEEYRADVEKGKTNVLTMLAQAIQALKEDLDEHHTNSSPTRHSARPNNKEPNRKVFIVHGHDDGPREAVARFLHTVGFIPIILNEQANQNRTVIEKIEAHGDVGFAVVLLTPDDEGAKRGFPPKPRARQNVLLELGYFMAKLGRPNVCALKRGNVEIPSDFAGVIWTDFDDGNAWKTNLAKELKAANFDIDWNRVMS